MTQNNEDWCLIENQPGIYNIVTSHTTSTTTSVTTSSTPTSTTTICDPTRVPNSTSKPINPAENATSSKSKVRDHVIKKQKLNTDKAKPNSIVSDTQATLSHETLIHPDIKLQNAFDPLVHEMDTDISPPNQNNPQVGNQDDNTNTDISRPKSARMPPIIVKNIPTGNFFANNKKLQSLLSQPLKITYSSEGIKYLTSCRDDYDKLYTILQTENLQFYSHEPRETKLLQVVLKGLPAFVESDTLKTELELLDFQIEHVRQITVPCYDTDGIPTRRRIPIWILTLPNNEHSRTIYQLQDINNHIIKIESYRPRPHITQCHKCQGFGHTSRRCNLPTRCVKCGNNHLFAECPLKGPVHIPKCANCDGAHTASYSQCPIQLKKKAELQEKLRNRRILPEERSTPPTWKQSDFPSLANPGNTKAFQSTFNTPRTTSSESISDSFKDIVNILRSLNIQHTLQLIRTTFHKIQNANDSISKVIIFIEGFINIFNYNNP